MGSRTFSTKEFADLVGRQPRTIYGWERSGKLVPNKDFNGRNIYTPEHYQMVMGVPLEEEQEVE